MVLFFSGTGNSRYIAQIIKETTSDELISMNDRIKSGDSSVISSNKPLVFVVPTYAWRIPRVVEEFIDATEFSGNKKAYFVMTCGDEIGNAAHYIEKLCRRKGFVFSGVAQIIMPENYVAMYDVPDQLEADQIIYEAKPAIQETVLKIASGEYLKPLKVKMVDKLKSSIICAAFYPLFVHANKFYSTDACIGCGKCVQLCPLNNVALGEQRPKWGADCTHCMACICGCPTQAIEYGKASQGKPRYYLESKER